MRLLTILCALACATPATAQTPRRNVVLFVADGLRSKIVRPDTAPNMARLRAEGVDFTNSHSLFPTFTTANASVMATGHYLGDTGDWSNTIYTGYPTKVAGGTTVTPFLESNPVLGDVDGHFGGDYLDEETILRAAARKGYQTAAVGKVGPTLIFDHKDRIGANTVIIDDQTGTDRGIPLPQWVADGLIRMAPKIGAKTPERGDNGKIGTKVANVEQQRWMVEAVSNVILPRFKSEDKPFLLVFWSRDPDGTQHYQGDSPNSLVPGINGPTSMAAIRNADANLGEIRFALAQLGLEKTTDVIVVADHGFSTIDKASRTSPAAQATYADTPKGELPLGFVAIDLATGLGLPLSDPDADNKPVGKNEHSKAGNGVIGEDAKNPKVVVADNGGSDLIYFPGEIDPSIVRRTIDVLLAQDYVSGLFVDDVLGTFPGTLPTSAINFNGKAVTPHPAIVVNFRSFSTGCYDAVLCTASIADTVLKKGMGMHGSLSRADTHNFMAAVGPSFKTEFVDAAPASNADVGRTIAAIMNIAPESRGTLVGRVLLEAFPGGETPDFESRTMRSEPAANGLRTILRYQTVGDTKYFTAGGFPGRTVGLD